MRFLVLFAVVLFGAPLVAAPVPKGAEQKPLYFPTAVGAKWVYETPDGELETAVVSAVEKGEDGALTVSRAGADGTRVAYTKTVVTANVLRRDDIEKAAKADKPFFLYLPLTSPHFPVVPSAAFKGKSKVGDYGDFVMQTDAVVGSVLDALKRSGAAENTLVIFTSDNGPEITGEVNPGAYDRLKQFGHASTGALRGTKRDAWEGGHRVPFIARWPGKIKANTTSDETICHVDLLATLAAALNVKLPADAGPDSVSVLPALLGEKRAAPVREATVHHSAQGKFAVRKGDWVLICAPTGDDNGKRGEPAWLRTERGYEAHTAAGELYDLAKDPTQKTNRYATEPAKVKELAALLERYVTDGRSTPGPKQKNDVDVIWDKRGK